MDSWEEEEELGLDKSLKHHKMIGQAAHKQAVPVDRSDRLLVKQLRAHKLEAPVVYRTLN